MILVAGKLENKDPKNKINPRVDYVINIPKNHPDGTYWYHPHHHGTVDEQVYRGLAGMLVVGRGDGGASELAGYPQRYMALEYVQLKPGGCQKCKDGNLWELANTYKNVNDPDLYFVVNGQEKPVIEMKERPEVWNIANLSEEGYYSLGLRHKNKQGNWEYQDLVVVANDGQPLTTPRIIPKNHRLIVPAAARYSIMVSNVSDGWELFTQGYNVSPFNFPEKTLVTIKGSAPKVDIPTQLTVKNNNYLPLNREPVDFYRQSLFTIPDNGNKFEINNQVFYSTSVYQPRLNTVEEWLLLNGSNTDHPYHIHVNDFQVQSAFAPTLNDHIPDISDWGQYNIAVPQTWYQDTVNLFPSNTSQNQISQPKKNLLIPPPGSVTLRMKPLDFLGSYVYHCHRLFHEDHGMMAMVTIIPHTPIYTIADIAGSHVRVYNSNNNHQIADLEPFGPNVKGVRVAVGDINKDGVMDIAAVPASGGPSEARIFYGHENSDLKLSYSQQPDASITDIFPHSFTGGLNVAVGDINSDGYDDLVVAPGDGGPAQLKVFSGVNRKMLWDYSDTSLNGYQGGLTVASAIVQDGGRYSIITGTGKGTRATLTVLDVDWYNLHGNNKPNQLPILWPTASSLIPPSGHEGGICVATGPVEAINGGFASILVSKLGMVSDGLNTIHSYTLIVPTDHPQVQENLKARGSNFTKPTLYLRGSFEPYPASNQDLAGLTVATVNTPIGADIIVGPLIKASTKPAKLPVTRWRWNVYGNAQKSVQVNHDFICLSSFDPTDTGALTGGR